MKKKKKEKERLAHRKKKESAKLLGQLYRGMFYRENKLDTGEDRINGRMERSQNIRLYCQS